jgi:tetratricopeptide (TPR) repeat protein
MRAALMVVLLTASAIATGASQSMDPAVAAREGFAAIAAGRAQEAAVRFDEALKTAPRDATLLLGAGVAARMLGRADAARNYLLTALESEPGLTAASLVLGEILYRSGDLEGAIHAYELALAQPGIEAALSHRVARKLDGWRKELDLHSRFGQRLGDHFTVMFEGPAEEALAQRAVGILESAYWRIGGALFTYPPGVITVVLYTREQFRDITQSPAWAAGAFDGRIRVPVQGALGNPREFDRVLTHEFTHALIRAVAPAGVPLWLDEGLAVYFEGSDRSGRRETVRQSQTPLPFAQLERSFERLDEARARLAYAQSAVAVEILIAHAGLQGVASLLADIGAGARFADAFERHLFMSYADLQKRMSGIE